MRYISDSLYAKYRETFDNMPVCKEHDEMYSIREIFNCDTKETRLEFYCYPCENIKLWNLARSVGK